VTLSFNLAPNTAIGDAVTAIQQATADLHLPPSIATSFLGSAQAFQIRHHRHREKGLQIAMSVPVHYCHRVARMNSQSRQSAREPADALVQRYIVITPQVAVDDFLLRRLREGCMQQVLDQERVVVCGSASFDEADGHGPVLP
jgi:hypothetical protein